MAPTVVIEGAASKPVLYPFTEMKDEYVQSSLLIVIPVPFWYIHPSTELPTAGAFGKPEPSQYAAEKSIFSSLPTSAILSIIIPVESGVP